MLPVSDAQERAIIDILVERDRQDELFGEQNHHPAYWLALIGKQMGQLGEAIVQREWSPKYTGAGIQANQSMRDEAIQVAAMAIAFIEAIDRGNLPERLVTAQPGNPRQRARALGIGDEQLNYDQDMGRTVKDVRLP